jgi:hypothetical protein
MRIIHKTERASTSRFDDETKDFDEWNENVKEQNENT